MKNYAIHVSKKTKPQTEQAKPEEVLNNAGGYVFKLVKFQQLNRFLILGSDKSYYQPEQELTRENAKCVEECLVDNGVETVQQIVSVSYSGKAPKNDAAIFALALACCAESVETRNAAFKAIPYVCRTGTHLFQFVTMVKELRSFGKGLRDGISSWYNDKNVEALSYQVCKYGQRDGMSHRDVLRLVHTQPSTDKHNALYRYIVTGNTKSDGNRFVKGPKNSSSRDREFGPVVGLPEFVLAFEELKNADEKRTIQLIEKYGFTHEMINTQHKNSADVWEALLENMPIHAMVRNLNKMTVVGLLKPLSQGTKKVCEKLNDEVKLRGSRMHPLTILGAERVYRKGKGDKGSLVWNSVPQVVDALDAAFYKSFDFVEPSNKNFLLGIDVSGSMSWPIPGTGLSSCDVVACIAMAIAKKEPNYYMHGFSGTFVDLGINKTMSLNEVHRKVQLANFGTTDCSLPMRFAENNNIDVDCFVTMTDNETHGGSSHVFQALKSYRNKMNKPTAKSIVLGTTATPFTVADPSDSHSLDLAGFSTDVPQLISSFAAGQF